EDACDLLTVVLGVQCVDSVAQLEPLHEEKLQSPSCRPGETGPWSAGDVSVLGHDASRGALYPEGLHVQKVRTEWVCRGSQTSPEHEKHPGGTIVPVPRGCIMRPSARPPG